MRFVRRKSDGQLFRASYPDNYSTGNAIADAMGGRIEFYFQSVAWRPRRWWFGGQWVDTGEIWEPESGEFNVVNEENERLLEQAISDGWFRKKRKQG